MASIPHRALLFGGVLFAAGTASDADTRVWFTPGDQGHSIKATAETNFFAYTMTSTVDGYENLDNFSFDYCGYGHGAYANASADTNIEVILYNYAWDFPCTGAAGSIDAYFRVFEPTVLYIYYNVDDAGEVSVFDAPVGGVQTLVAGPGAVAAGDGGRTHHVIQPGRYRAIIDAVAQHDETSWSSVSIGYEARCVCDVVFDATLNVDDIEAFAGAFVAGDLAVDFDESGALNIDDIDAFVACYLTTCRY